MLIPVVIYEDKKTLKPKKRSECSLQYIGGMYIGGPLRTFKKKKKTDYVTMQNLTIMFWGYFSNFNKKKIYLISPQEETLNRKKEYIKKTHTKQRFIWL